MKTIHHVVDIEAPAEAVWAALTAPDGLARWWSTRVDPGPAAVGGRTHWPFAGDFHPVMETVAIEDGRCRLRFWQEYAVELADDYYGVYNFNWGYYLQSLRLYATTGTGKPFLPPG